MASVVEALASDEGRIRGGRRWRSRRRRRWQARWRGERRGAGGVGLARCPGAPREPDRGAQRGAQGTRAPPARRGARRRSRSPHGPLATLPTGPKRTAETARAHAAARAATRVERDADVIAERLAGSLSPQAEAWTRDLDLVFVGRDRETAARDPVLARYRVDRAVAAIAPTLARALSAIVPEVDLAPARLARRLAPPFAPPLGARPPRRRGLLSAVAQAAVATLVEQLLAMSVASAAVDGRGGGPARAQRVPRRPRRAERC